MSVMSMSPRFPRMPNETLPSGCESVPGAVLCPRPPKDTVTSGILVIDKPEGTTSFGVVAQIRRVFALKKVGHCGTLDPFATGVLLVCLNQATRISDHLISMDKIYRFTVRFGEETDTLDLTGQITATSDAPAPGEDRLREVLRGFSGTQTQRTPRFAAAKVGGKRLYELSRRGIEVEPPDREITLHRLELLGYEWPHAVFEVHCSKGTYVRQIAADIGSALGCGAHVTSLRRLVCGRFDLGAAVELDRLVDPRHAERWTERLVSMHSALDQLPAVTVEGRILERLCLGNLDPVWETEQRGRFAGLKGPVRLSTREQVLIGLWWPNPDAGRHKLRLLAEQGASTGV